MDELFDPVEQVLAIFEHHGPLRFARLPQRLETRGGIRDRLFEPRDFRFQLLFRSEQLIDRRSRAGDPSLGVVVRGFHLGLGVLLRFEQL